MKKITQDQTTDLGFAGIINDNADSLGTSKKVYLQRETTVDGKTVIVEGITPAYLKATLNQQLEAAEAGAARVTYGTPGGEEYIPVSNGTDTAADGLVQIYDEAMDAFEDKFTITFNCTPEDGTLVVENSDGEVEDPDVGGDYMLAAGDYTYSYSKEGYASVTDVAFTVSADATITVTLESLNVIIFDCTPNDGTMYVRDSNNVLIPAASGKTYYLADGSYSYTYARNGYLSAGNVPLTVSAEATVTVVLEQLFTITFNCTPEDGTLVVEDSESVAQTANEDGTYSLIAGDYTYSYSADGYTAVTDVAFTVSADATVTVALEA